MPIPTTREETTRLVTTSFNTLMAELDSIQSDVGSLECVNGWTVKDVLALRSWWTTSLADWIETGAAGGNLDLPAEGYTWRETPRLNADVVTRSRAKTYAQVKLELQQAFDRIIRLIDELTDDELLRPGVFSWAGKWPIARWISINTARQYTTARTFIRRALREQSRSGPRAYD
jgi:hypothetical protein